MQIRSRVTDSPSQEERTNHQTDPANTAKASQPTPTPIKSQASVVLTNKQHLSRGMRAGRADKLGARRRAPRRPASTVPGALRLQQASTRHEARAGWRAWGPDPSNRCCCHPRASRPSPGSLAIRWILHARSTRWGRLPMVHHHSCGRDGHVSGSRAEPSIRTHLPHSMYERVAEKEAD